MSYSDQPEPLLARLRIPFCRFAPDGCMRFASESAMRLLSTDGPNLIRELGDMARALHQLAATHPASITSAEHTLSRSHWHHTIHVLLEHVGDRGATNDVLCVLVAVPRRAPRPLRAPPVISEALVDGLLVSRGLSERERQVALLLWGGATSAEIADNLQVTVHTARRHTERVFRKLRVRSRSAVGRAITEAIAIDGDQRWREGDLAAD